LQEGWLSFHGTRGEYKSKNWRHSNARVRYYSYTNKVPEVAKDALKHLALWHFPYGTSIRISRFGVICDAHWIHMWLLLHMTIAVPTAQLPFGIVHKNRPDTSAAWNTISNIQGVVALSAVQAVLSGIRLSNSASQASYVMDSGQGLPRCNATDSRSM